MTTPLTRDRVLTSAELAARYGVTVQTVERWVRDYGVPVGRTPGRQLRFTPAQVDALLQAAEVAGARRARGVLNLAGRQS